MLCVFIECKKEVNEMKLPLCCGTEMKSSMELGRFTEVQCGKCGDVVYVKRYSQQKPVMLDD